MNLNIPYSWIKEFVGTSLPPEDFARRVSEAGMGVERIHRLGSDLDDIVLATVTEVNHHPNADRLKVAIVDIGKELIEVVCGGTNLAVGQKVAFAKVGSKVRWHGEGDLIELVPALIRGVKSFGMVCAAEEIGLGDWFKQGDHEILDLSWLKGKNGTPLREALDLDDVIFEVEITTNRPDALSAVGLAREASAILKERSDWKDVSVGLKRLKPEGAKLGIKVTVKDKRLCPRYQAIAMSGASVASSPWRVQKRLLAAGVKPIANAVDITNYVMLELGQPLHVFDRAKLAGGEIVVREAVAGERLRALDGRDYELKPGMLVIADAEKPVAIAGVIGGADSAVSETTKDIVFESANFDPVSVRKTARALGLHTDASQLFEKGLSTEATAGALVRAVGLARELCDAKVASSVIDVRRGPYKSLVFPFDPKKCEALIGVPVAEKEMVRVLSALGFAAKKVGKKYKVVVPWWRDHDIEDGRDFSEEVARIHGYGNLPSVLPPGVPPLREPDRELVAEDRLKGVLAAAGAMELFTYSFVSEKELAAVTVQDAIPVRVANPLVEDFGVMRTSLVPSMLLAVKANQNERPNADCFEVSRVYLDRIGSGLPEERLVCLVACVGDSPKGELFARAKGFADRVATDFGAPFAVEVEPGADRGVWHPGRVAKLMLNGVAAGHVGEVSADLLAKFGIDRRVAFVEFPVKALIAAARPNVYRPIPLFPPVKRDVSFVLDARKTHDEAVAVIRKSDSLITAVQVFDIYQGKGVPVGKKSMAFHLVLSLPDRTLTTEEADRAIARLVSALESKLGAEIRK